MAAWVSLPDFQAFVGNTNAADAPALQAAINTGCAKVDELCGPTVTTSITERVPGGGYELPLATHATAITSIATWRDGTALTASDFVVEDQVIFRKDGGWIDDDLTVVYTAGSAAVPDWAASAAKLIAHQWFKSRLRPNQTDAGTSLGYLVPNQAKELMETHLLAPDGFA